MLIPVTDADVPQVVALMNRAYRGADAAPGWSTEAGYITGSRTTEPLLREQIAGTPGASLLKWVEPGDERLHGCVWLEPVGDGLWYLGSLAIDPARQNGGLGRTLLEAAEAWVRARGARRVRMSVIHVRDVLIGWYVRRGYRLTGETAPFPYGDDRFGTPLRDDLRFVILEKALDGAA